VTCVKITCRYGWTCASTTPVVSAGAENMKPSDWKTANLEDKKTDEW